MRHPILRGIGLIVALIVTAYLAAIAYLFVFQRDYVFRPGGALAQPAELGLPGVEVLEFRMADGTVLTGWHAHPAPGLPSVLYFHGNAGNLSDRADRFKEILASGFGLTAVSYRGFAGSGGEPSEAALFADALEVYDWVALRNDDIVIHGESLGSGVAAYVAAERRARALILEAPYTAALDIAAATYPWVPVAYLMRDPFLTRDHIKRVEEPVLILHGTADAVVPVEHGRRLFEAAGAPKQLAIVDGAGHSDLWEHGLWPAVLEFLTTTAAAQPAAEVRRMPSFAA